MNELAKNDNVNWAERKRVVESALVRIPQRSAFLTFIEGVAEGKKTKQLLKDLRMSWPDFVDLYGYDKRLYALYMEAKERGELFRQAMREDEADRRAMDGVERPVYHKGEVCGYVKEYSDQLLALQLKAGNPDKYAERKQVDVKGVMLNLNVHGVDRAPRDVTDEG